MKNPFKRSKHVNDFMENLDNELVEAAKKRFPEYPIIFSAITTVKDSPNHEFSETRVVGDLVRSRGKYYIHPIGNAINVVGELGKTLVLHEVQPDTIKILWTGDK